MMTKKTTRRVALGTAVACLASFPFALRYFRGGRRGLPEDKVSAEKWRRGWMDCIPVEEPDPSVAAGEKEYVLSPPVGTAGTIRLAVSADGMYSTLIPSKGSEIPDTYALANYRFEVKRYGGDTVFSGQLLDANAVSRYASRQIDYVANWTLAVRGNKLVDCSIRRGKIIDTPTPENFLKMIDLGPFMMLGAGIPSQPLIAGQQIPVSVPSPDGIVCPAFRKCLGLVRVGDISAVQVQTDVLMDEKTIIDFMDSLERQLSKKSDKDRIGQEMETIRQNKGLSIHILADDFYRQDHGLLAFRREKKTVHYPSGTDDVIVTLMRVDA